MLKIKGDGMSLPIFFVVESQIEREHVDEAIR